MTFLTTVFRTTASLRGARAFHPRGTVCGAVWRPEQAGRALLGASPVLDGERPATIRLSHGIGLPAAVPDLTGVAVKLHDVHGAGRDQDLLFTSSGTGLVGRHLLRPTRQLSGGAFSTLLPYELGGGDRHALVAVAPHGPSVSYLEVTEGAAPPAFEVRVAGVDGPLLGTVSPAGDAQPGDDPSLAFDPWNTGPELRPVGWVNRLRRPTYGASRAGRPRR